MKFIKNCTNNAFWLRELTRVSDKSKGWISNLEWWPVRPRTTLCTLLLYYYSTGSVAVTLHCSLPLLATDQNAKLTHAEIRETDYTNVAAQHVFPHSNRFSFYLPLSLAPFKSFWRKFFFLMKISTSRESTAAFQKLQFSVVEKQTQLMILLIMQFKNFISKNFDEK